MEIRVLGSAAGGGVPQWNCQCPNCARARGAESSVRPRTQSSVAVRGAGTEWILINASPDLRQQIPVLSGFHKNEGPRAVALGGVILVDSQIDHCAGLLLLRESATPLPVYTTDRVHEDLTGELPLLPLLQHYCGVEWHRVPIDGKHFHVASIGDVRFTAVPLRSKAPPYSPHRGAPQRGDNIGLLIEDESSGRRIFYAPGIGELDAVLAEVMGNAQCLLVDGTTWSDDEMILRGTGSKRAAEMGHVSQWGKGGMIEWLRQFDARKILIHINNTNPILDENSPQRALLAAEGIEIACDGMQILI